MHVIVLGCGVSGLSCGIRLLKAGHTVEFWARELPPHTTLDVAAAAWYPYRAFSQDRVTAWAQRIFDVLSELSARLEARIQVVRGVELFDEAPPDPWRAPCVPSLRAATPEELVPGYSHGYSFEAPIIEMPRYLPFLLARLRELGGRILQREVRARGRALGYPQLRSRRRGRHPLLGLCRGSLEAGGHGSLRQGLRRFMPHQRTWGRPSGGRKDAPPPAGYANIRTKAPPGNSS